MAERSAGVAGARPKADALAMHATTRTDLSIVQRSGLRFDGPSRTLELELRKRTKEWFEFREH